MEEAAACKMVSKSTFKGFIGALILLAVYFGLVSAISGWDFAIRQFSVFWYFIVSLAAGFGAQVGLYSYLKDTVRLGRVVAVSGTTSTIAMVSCCAHYLINILPIIGIAGIVSLVGQYQIELFWVGIAFNASGVAYIANRIRKIPKHEQ